MTGKAVPTDMKCELCGSDQPIRGFAEDGIDDGLKRRRISVLGIVWLHDFCLETVQMNLRGVLGLKDGRLIRRLR